MALHSWLASSLVRHFPLTPVQPAAELTIDAALNERFSFQVVLRMEDQDAQHVVIDAQGPEGWALRVRRVGFVPLLHHNRPIERDSADTDGKGHIPGYVPDPLYDEDTLFLPAGETHAFWITVSPGPASVPGDHTIRIAVRPEKGDSTTHAARVRLHEVTLGERQGFAVTHWFYVDALIDWYKTDYFDARFWNILPKYVRNVVQHGQDTLYVPVFTPPLDGVKRPSQLLHITRSGSDTYVFDWRDVKRYVELAQRQGITHFEWCHFFTQWGVRNAIRIYEGQGADEQLLWSPDTSATSSTYRTFLSQFLPELHRFLSEEKILDRSFFHVSDEPHGDEHLANYRQARAVLRDLAPWMDVMDALTEIEFARQGLTDMPIPSIRSALDFANEGIPSWCYYCCGPRGKFLNRLLDTPLPKIAMHGFLFYHWPFGGFLHWGYNYWYESQTRNLVDPFSVQDGLAWQRGWAYGDPFVVYPGPDGPLDSIRWEIFAESLQDYALLQALGVPRDHPILDPLISFEEFPKTGSWRRDVRSLLLSQRGAPAVHCSTRQTDV